MNDEFLVLLKTLDHQGDRKLKIEKLTGMTLLAIASTVHAQSSVTLYGHTDTGFLYQSNNGALGAGGPSRDSVFMFNGTGGEHSNVFGFRGNEDLGSGWQAGFQLEEEFDVGTGAENISGSIFSNYSNVFLQGPYGTVRAGQQIDPAYLAMGRVDPRDLGQSYSAAGWWNFLEGTDTEPGETVDESNSLSYTYKTRNIWSSVLYRFGNQSGAMSQGRTISTGLVYDDGTFVGSGSFLIKNDSKGSVDLRIWSGGAGVRVGDFYFRALFTDYSMPEGNDVALIGTSPAAHVIVGGAGVNWQLSPIQRLTAAYYFSENRYDTTNASSSYVISDDYSLSKATSIYGFVGLMASKKGATGMTNLTSAALTGGYAGTNTTTVGFGLVHRF